MTCLATLNDLFTSHQGYFRLGSERWQVPRIYRWPSQREVLSICFCWRLIRASFPVSERKQEIQLALPAIPWWLQGMDKRAAELRLCLNKKYASSLQSIIEKNNLQKYDQMVRPVWTSTRTSKGKDSRLRTTTAKLCLRCNPQRRKEFPGFHHDFHRCEQGDKGKNQIRWLSSDVRGATQRV